MAVMIILMMLMFGKGIEAETFVDSSTKLKKRLFEKYDKDIRPSPVTTVTLSDMSLWDLRYDERSSIMEILVHIKLVWADRRLTWNVSEYAEVGDKIKVSPEKLWLPDLAVYNSATIEDIWNLRHVMAIVSSHGNVLWVPPAKFRVICVSDLTLWPRDTQSCFVTIGAWTHSGHQINLRVFEGAIVDSEDLRFSLLADGSKLYSTQWNVQNITLKRNTTYYRCCPEPYFDAKINVTIRRNAPAFTRLVQVPTICLSLLTLVVFLLPPSAVEKVTFGGLCLILNMIFMAYTSNIVAHSPTHTPLIVDLLCTQLQLLVLSIVVSALMIRIAAKPHSYQVPSALMKGLRLLSFYLCLHNYLEMDPDDDSHSRSYPDTLKDRDMETGSSQDIPLTSSMYSTLSNESSCPKGDNPPGYASLPAAPKDAIHPSSEDPLAIQSGQANPECPRSQDIHLRRRSHSHEWLLLAATVDRLAFLLYLAACIGTLSRYRLALV